MLYYRVTKAHYNANSSRIAKLRLCVWEIALFIFSFLSGYFSKNSPLFCCIFRSFPRDWTDQLSLEISRLGKWVREKSIYLSVVTLWTHKVLLTIEGESGFSKFTLVGFETCKILWGLSNTPIRNKFPIWSGLSHITNAITALIISRFLSMKIAIVAH